MRYRRVSLLLPTRKRPQLLKSFLDSYHATASGEGDSEIVFRVDDDDLESLQLLAGRGWLVIVGPRRQGYRSMASFYNEMARLATGDILMCCNDDIVIETPGWSRLIIEAANRYPDGIFNIGVSTVMNEDFYVFPCVSCKLTGQLGFLFDERLIFHDIYWRDVVRHFGRLHKLWTVRFRHEWAGWHPDQTRLDAFQHQTSLGLDVFPDGSWGWKEAYQKLHDTAVAEAVSRISEILASQALIAFEEYDPGPAQSDRHWPPTAPPLPWSAPRGGAAGIHYHRGELFELFKAIAARALPRRKILLASGGNGLSGLLWGQLYERVVMLNGGGQSRPLDVGKYRVEFGAWANPRLTHGILSRLGETDALVLDDPYYDQLTSQYCLFRRAMRRPSLIVVMSTGSGHGSTGARRFVDELASGRLDGRPHRLAHIELPGGSGVSYEVVE